TRQSYLFTVIHESCCKACPIIQVRWRILRTKAQSKAVHLGRKAQARLCFKQSYDHARLFLTSFFDRAQQNSSLSENPARQATLQKNFRVHRDERCQSQNTDLRQDRMQVLASRLRYELITFPSGTSAKLRTSSAADEIEGAAGSEEAFKLNFLITLADFHR